jgi:hypothetical protein
MDIKQMVLDVIEHREIDYKGCTYKAVEQSDFAFIDKVNNINKNSPVDTDILNEAIYWILHNRII